MPDPPSPEVLDLFAVPDAPEPIPGGQGGSVRAGDLVLSPGRDAAVAAWLNPVLARLAVRLDERPGRVRRDLRIAVPVPARDGSWVVDGWGASRYEPGTVACRDLDVLVAAGRLLHAELAVAVPRRPAGLDERSSRWDHAEDAAFGPTDRLLGASSPSVRRAVAALTAAADGAPDGAPDRAPDGVIREQLVHRDLAGNLLLDAAGAPVVIDVAPAWRRPRWAEAVAVLDSVLWHDAPWAALDGWAGADLPTMLRAVVFRALSDPADHQPRYDAVLDRLGVAASVSR